MADKNPIPHAAAALVKSVNNLLGLLEGYAGGCAVCTDSDHKTMDHPPTQDREGLVHTEETLMKVRRALFMILGRTIDSQQITDCISEMLQAGILFRERSDRG